MILASLSVQDFVDKVGAYVGFAAAIGLALFALLLFAQARELKRLREWGAHTHDRIGELERRLAAALELARRASTSQRTGAHPAHATQPARPAAVMRPAGAPDAPGGVGARGPQPARTSSPTRLPLLPAAPARVAGAALGSATMVVPLPKRPPGTASAPAAPPAQAPAQSAPATAPAVPPAAVPAAAAAATSAASAGVPPAPATAAAQAPAQPAAPSPAPQPAPAGTNGHSDTFPPVPPVRRPAPARSGRRPPARGEGRPVPARARSRPAPRRPAAAPLRARSVPSATPLAAAEAPHGRRRLLLLLGGLALAALTAIAVIALSGGGSDTPSSAPAFTHGTSAGQTTRGGRSTTPAAAAPAHDRITVAVLNGTTTAGLARTVAGTLTADGFLPGSVTNASDQQRSVTVVSYFGGHEAEAREVARTLGVPSDAVQPIDADTETACGQGGACTATVVVTVGADRQ